MKDVSVPVQIIVGKRFDGTAFTKVFYDLLERSVIFTDNPSEIRLNLHCVESLTSNLSNAANWVSCGT